jgi:hypothetical protein
MVTVSSGSYARDKEVVMQITARIKKTPAIFFMALSPYNYSSATVRPKNRPFLPSKNNYFSP